MAEGMLGGVLGDEDEKPQIEARESLAGAEAFAAAVAAKLAGTDPEVARGTCAFLQEQTQILKVQKEHLIDEHALRIAHLRHQLHLLRWQRLGQKLRIGFQIFLALIATAAATGFAVMIWDAMHDHGLVIEAFSVPPDFADKGLTGRVVAKQLVERIADLNNNGIDSIRASSSYALNWGNDIKVDIPETGVSIGEVVRLLHDKLGHATHIDGEIYRSESGIVLTVQVGDGATIQSAGSEGDLKTLVQRAADEMYARTQPYRYGVWLLLNSRWQEAQAAFRRLADEGSPEERIWGLHGLAITADTLRERADADREAVRLDPTFSVGWGAVGFAEFLGGHDEAALAAAREAAKMAQDSDRQVSRTGLARARSIAAMIVAEELGDSRAAVAEGLSASEQDTSRIARTADRRRADIAKVDAHDIGGMKSDIAQLPVIWVVEGIPGSMTYPLDLRLAAEEGDWERVVTLAEQIRSAHGEPHIAISFPSQLDPLLAEGYARLGRNVEADAVLSRIPADVYDGWRARGRIAALRHDYAGADKAFAEAARQAPSIPRAFADWGDMLAGRGDTAGAIAKFKDANQRGPHWADPLKSWGDVLAKQGHSAEALTKYDEALKFAPKWVVLQQAREALAKQRN